MISYGNVSEVTTGKKESCTEVFSITKFTTFSIMVRHFKRFFTGTITPVQCFEFPMYLITHAIPKDEG